MNDFDASFRLAVIITFGIVVGAVLAWRAGRKAEAQQRTHGRPGGPPTRLDYFTMRVAQTVLEGRVGLQAVCPYCGETQVETVHGWGRPERVYRCERTYSRTGHGCGNDFIGPA